MAAPSGVAISFFCAPTPFEWDRERLVSLAVSESPLNSYDGRFQSRRIPTC